MNSRIETSPLATYQSHLDRGELAYQVNKDGRPVFFPRVSEPRTGDALEWRISKGLGTVYATTVNHVRNEAPRHVALIDMDEGFRLMSRVEDLPPDEVRIGLRVRLRVLPGKDGVPTLPVFVPASGEPS